MSQNKSFVPLFISLGVVAGILTGSFFANHFSGNRLAIINNSSNKVMDLFHLIDDQYVDSVNIPQLVERSLPQLLKELDPHSTYIPAEEVEASTQELRGSFSGIGVQFTIFQDTIRVVKVIKGGPAESVGMIAGDRIVRINGETYIGDTITNDGTMKRLKGPKGTEARLEVKRAGKAKLQKFNILRGEVPVRTVDAAYMVTPTIGYIRISSFGDNTYAEFLAALANLQAQDFEKLMIDLRGNPGGYMETAIQIANEFLPKNALIVYTEGRKSPRREYRTDGRGTYQTMPLVVLVDETSASASEIFAGAMQDNDRATIIGRRSFGKGLVQQPIPFNDGSMIRLTIARYYTPSGRCIQKPYTMGDEKSYEEDLLDRYQHGEFFSQDSIRHSGKAYHTSIGRVVYGGGGITPDIFIPEDTTNVTSYYKEASMTGLILQFAFNYTDNNRQKMNEFADMKELAAYLVKQNTVEKFAEFANKNGLKRRNLMIKKSHKLLERYINSRIIYNMLNDEAWTQYLNLDDPAIAKTLDIFRRKAAFPKKAAL